MSYSFTQAQVLHQVRQIQAHKLPKAESSVYLVWLTVATQWLIDDRLAFLNDGFVGFNQRPAEQIVLDLHLGQCIWPPLTQAEYDKFFARGLKRLPTPPMGM